MDRKFKVNLASKISSNLSMKSLMDEVYGDYDFGDAKENNKKAKATREELDNQTKCLEEIIELRKECGFRR
jgi:hypothetical protein